MIRKILSSVGLGIVLLFIYFPIVIIAVYSFLDTPTIGASGHFTFQNYIKLFTTPELTEMILGTLSLALKCGIIATILGTTGAIGAFYSNKGMRRFVVSANQIPIVNADVVTGFSLCVLLIVVFGMDKSTLIPLIIGHVVLATPFVYLSVVPKLKQMDINLYEAALDLGASPAQALRKIVLPQIAPGIITGFFIAVTLSLDDYFITIYTKPATFNTISTYVVNATRGSHTEIKTALWALSTVIFVIILLAVLIRNAMTNRTAGDRSDTYEI